MSRIEVIGNATLYLGDCRDILPTLPKVDAVITDPPYGLAGHETEKNDYISFSDTQEEVYLLVKWLIECGLWTRLVMTPGQKMMFKYAEPAAVGAIYYPAGTGSCSWGFVGWQPIFYYGKDPILADGKGRAMNSFSSTESAEKYDHPCVKPTKLWTRLVDRCTRPDEIVLDPFMGSGTTGVSCANLGRRFIGCEIEPKYFDIACRRIDDAQRQARLIA